MTILYIIECTQIILLTILICIEISKKNRNIFFIVTSALIIILLPGQGLWVLNYFSENNVNDMMHIYQSLSIDSVYISCYYSLIFIVIYIASFLLFSLKKNKKKITLSSTDKKIKKINFYSYIFISVATFVFGALLISSGGGFYASLTSPGMNLSGGVGMLMTLMSIGKLPLLYKIAVRRNIVLWDVFLFSFVFILTLLNSRTSAVFIMFQLIILLNYCRKQLNRRELLIFPIVGIIIIFVFGLYREFTSNYPGSIELIELFNFFLSYNLMTIINWFYASNTEVFTGLAGILTYENNINGLNYDYGISSLYFILNLIPSAIRESNIIQIQYYADIIKNSYPYLNGSIVSSLIESYYGHFSLSGIIFLGLFMGYLVYYFDERMRYINSNTLLVGLLSVQLFRMIRGPETQVYLYFVTEYIIYKFYKFTFLLTDTKNQRI